jgi:3D (Asp-Asp-Asp) domain-containing protein
VTDRLGGRARGLALVLVLAGALAPGVAQARPISHSQWLSGVRLTEYFPAPEAWANGRLVLTPGLGALHRIDWLYSAHGLSMEGDGIGLDGQMYHIAGLGQGGWVDASGHSISIGAGASPYWRAGGYWRNSHGAVTYPLASGGWSDGTGRSYRPLPGVSFAPGSPLPLVPWESIAVDPRLIPLGSWVYIPAARMGPGKGWFLAQDTGGAIKGRHLDIYRTPPASSADPGESMAGQQVFVLPPSAQSGAQRRASAASLRPAATMGPAPSGLPG